MWRHSIDQLDIAEHRGAPVRSNIEKYYVTPERSTSETLPIGAIYGLRESRGIIKEGIERPNIVAAANLIRKNSYRPRMVRAFGQGQLYFQSTARVFAEAGIFTLSRPLRFEAIPGVIAQLEQHWRETGLQP